MSDRLAPEGKLDLSTVSELYAQLKERSGQDVILDLGQVTALGALCLQLFLAAAREARATGMSFEVVNVPDAVSTQIESMGFTAASLAEGAI